jgi:hypothetical protein
MQAVVIHAPKDLRIGEMTLPVNAIVTKDCNCAGRSASILNLNGLCA